MRPLVHHDDHWYGARLAEPRWPVRLVIDTDAANEIDDQFALAWALLSPVRMQNRSILRPKACDAATTRFCGSSRCSACRRSRACSPAARPTWWPRGSRGAARRRST